MVVDCIGLANAIFIVKAEVDMTKRVIVVVGAGVDGLIPERFVVDFVVDVVM